jgi:endoglucanase
VVVAARPAADFTVRRAADRSAAFKGRLSPPADDADSGDRVQLADFTRLDEGGEFYLDVAGVGRSWKFRIGRDVYARAFYLSTRSFYGQRCGTPVDLGAEFPGYAHAACHTSGAFHPSSGKKGPARSVRGWHDAGDYGRYVVNSGISTGTLLWAWELFGPRIRRFKLNIPESGNHVPDFLDEVRWNLDWMLSMQDEDGGVWHKQTSERFADFLTPEQDALVSQIVGTGREPFKSSCATADFAAVTAVAARVYRPFDAAYTRKTLEASRRAWAWLDKHPAVQFKNPAGVSTGEYGDRVCEDERLWAAAELWRTTREEVYHRHFLKSFAAHQNTLRANAPPSWANVAPLALWSYVLGRGGDATAVNVIKRDTLRAADDIYLRTERNGYRVSLTPDDYVWGSNGVVANYGMQLLVANAVRADRRYVAAALENLHYLLGRNTFSLSFVTRVGANPFRHPHHRPSAADRNEGPWPGLLSGGPNRNRQDPAMKKLGSLPPAKMYLDEVDSYASNEIAINWNAPLVLLLAGTLSER